MKKRFAVFSVAVVVLIAWAIFKPSGRIGTPVPPSMVPPPVVVTLKGTNYPLRVFPGVGSVLFRLPDGSLWCWGTTPPASLRVKVPQQVGTNCDWVEAFAANNHCVGLRTDGTLWEWGYCGNQQNTSVPTRVGQDQDWMSIAAGDMHSVALKRDGTLWGWGDNSSGQLGASLGTHVSRPEQIGTNCDWKAISCGQGSHTIALRMDGSLWLWGNIFMFGNGQPGVVLSAPTQVCSDTNWTGLASGGLAEAFTESEVWYPLESPPNAMATRASVCRLIRSNSAPAHMASAVPGRPELYEVRADGTLWAKVNPLGPWAKANGKWFQVGQRKDWLSIWGSGTAFGLTADGTVWMWGQDLGQDPILDAQSKYKVFEARVLGWFGMSAGAMTTLAYAPYQKEPRPLMRFAPGPQPRE